LSSQVCTKSEIIAYLLKYVAKTEPIFEVETKANAKFAQHLQTDAGRHIHCRVISAPEVAARLLHIPHAKGTDRVIFLETDLDERVRRLKPKWQLDTMEAGSTDVCWAGKLEQYIDRPTENQFNDLLYPQYFEQYRILSSGETEPRGRPVYKDRQGRRVVARGKPVYCRWHFKKPHVDKDAFYFQQACCAAATVLHPWLPCVADHSARALPFH